MKKMQSGVCKGKIWIIPSQESEEINSQFVIADREKISNIDLSWYESKIAFARKYWHY